MLNLSKTTEQLIYEKTCQDEFDKFLKNTSTKKEKKEYPNAYPAFPMNRLVYSLTYNNTIKNLSRKYHSVPKNEVFGYSNEENYNNQINFSQYIDVIKLGEHNFTFKEAMDIIRSVREDIGPEVFYGAVIANHEHVDVNPLHPLVLSEFMRFSADELIEHGLTNYTVIIYTFNDKIKKFKKDHPLKFEVNPEYFKDVINLVAGAGFKQESFSFISNQKLIFKKNKFIIEYKEVVTDLEGNELKQDNEKDEYTTSHIVPGQILNLNGMTYPYYGAIYIKSGLAWNLSPMWATNIDNPERQNTWKTGSSICTKVGNSATADGCKTLNHSNTTSQRNPYTFTDGAMGYAQVAVDVALSTMYDEYNPTKHAVVYRKLSQDEFFIENKDATRRDYLNYLKKRIKGNN